MKTLLLLSIVASLLVSCQQSTPPTPPEKVRVPIRQENVDLSPTKNKVDATDKKLSEARSTAKRLESQLDSVRRDVDEAEQHIEAAFSDGLIAGSLEAQVLRDSFAKVDAELERTRKESDTLTKELQDTSIELEAVEDLLAQAELYLAKMLVERDELRVTVTKANENIGKAADDMELLKKKNTKLETNLENSRTWRNRWMWGFIGLASLLIFYIWARLQSFGWIK